MPDNDIRRNDPCPCGSGRRYKNCHGALQVRATDSPALIARAQFAAGAIAEAERSARAAVERDETDADAWTVLGMCIEASQPEAALAAFEKAVALAPKEPEPPFRLGDFRRRRGEHDAAIASYEAALASGQRHPVLLNNLGLSQQASGRLDQAVALYSEALALQPNLTMAHANLGDALRLQHRYPEAVTHYLQALAVTQSATLWVMVGLCRHALGRPDDAREAFERALALEPDNPHALVNIASLLNAEQRFEEAAPLLEKALAIQPDFTEASNHLLYVRQQLCDWRDFDRLFERQRASLNDPNVAPVMPHNLFALPYTPAELLAATRKWAERHLGPIAPRSAKRPQLVNGKLRIAYIGPDFRSHPLANLLTEVIERHDRSRFEVFGYSFGPDDGSPARARFAAAFDHFIDIRSESIEKTVHRIKEDRVGVLLDTSGYVMHSRSEIFAQRPAPIQINCIGFPGTLGADCYDYILTDSFVTPPEQQANFTERFMLMPHCYLPGDSKRPIAATPTREQCGLPAKGFVFCCFNGSYKITPAMFDVWMRVLRAVPDSVLWLLESGPAASANLRYEAECREVSPERLIFAPRVPLPEHLARHAVADLFLDTFPCNAHTTANDALFAGLPLLTCAGETFASRVSGSQLRAVELEELVTESLEAYEAKAIDLAHETAKMVSLCQRLDRDRPSCDLFDAEGYTRALDNLLTGARDQRHTLKG